MLFHSLLYRLKHAILIATMVLLAIQMNLNRSILGVVLTISRNSVGNLTVQIWFRYQPSYLVTANIEGATLKITKFMPLIMTTVVPSSILVGLLLGLNVTVNS